MSIPFPKGNIQLCQLPDSLISLISLPSKEIILNRLKPQAEKSREGQEETQIFNLRILADKYIKHEQDLYHVFIDFKKAFGRVLHAALWATMKKYDFGAKFIKLIEKRYKVQSQYSSMAS